jgi:hypothetical protein
MGEWGGGGVGAKRGMEKGPMSFMVCVECFFLRSPGQAP